MTVATAFAVSWKPLTNSNPSAISSARPSSMMAPVASTGPPAPLTSRNTLYAM